ncbi:MAG: M23 family metallopeptidase [Roseiflexus sp.]
MGPSRTHILLPIMALIGAAILVMQTQSPPILLSRWKGAIPGVDRNTRQSIQAAFVAQPATERPSGNPLRDRRTVITQGYGVGTHAPASVWGGIDLAIDSDGDGNADPQGTWRVPVYATHDGFARVKPDTWPGGNYLAIENDRYMTAYAHLDSYAVVDGQPVARGQVIGYVGSTGMSSGPHLHYEVWESGVNRNPLDFDALRSDD